MIYLNWNIEKIADILLNQDIKKKIATMIAADDDIGEYSMAGIVSVRVFQPDYSLSIEYSQSGNYDNYKETEALHLSFGRENIIGEFDDLTGPDEGGIYYDESNKEKLSWDDLVDLDLTNGSLMEETETAIKEYLDELKDNAVRCPVCDTTNVKKSGVKDMVDGVHQEYYCKNKNTDEHPIGKPKYFRSDWTF